MHTNSEILPASHAAKDKKNKNSEKEKTIDKLFVYGSLNNDYHLQLLTGKLLPYEEGILLNHRRIEPDNSFPFAVYWKGYSIKGRLICSVTPDIIAKLDEYENEGELYERKTCKVKVGDKIERAFVYCGKIKAIKPYVKKGFEERDRIEEFVDKNVSRYLEQKAGHFLNYDREKLSVKVTRELLSEEVHSLLRQFFQDIGLPSFIIKHEIEKASIPRLSWLKDDSKAQKYADNYMLLAVNLMIFNQLEEKFRNDYRYYVKVADAYYVHTLSAVMALKLLVDFHQSLTSAMTQLGVDRWDPNMIYTDYAVAAIFIAEELYTRDRADKILTWLKSNRHIGAIPMGAELEFSNLGYRTIGAKENDDELFDTFNYFYDFDLMRRGWKLGAHVDDHGFLASTKTRTRGFLELAFGRYKLLGDVSKPATQDSWVLSKIIDLSVRFINIRPHSLHISLGTKSDQKFNEVKELEHYLCLLTLGGDLREDDDGKLCEMRIHRGEIESEGSGILFSRLNRHHKQPEDSSWSFVVEYQFPRLYYEYDYQPLITTLKGFQLGANPYPIKGCKKLEGSQYTIDIESSLRTWAASPTPISANGIDSFLSIVEKGLDKESEQAGIEYGKYANRILGRIEEILKRRNRRVEKYNAKSKEKSSSAN